MKIPNKREPQQITFNHSSNIDFKDFILSLQKVYYKTKFFLVIDITLPSDNSLRFRKNFLEIV